MYQYIIKLDGIITFKLYAVCYLNFSFLIYINIFYFNSFFLIIWIIIIAKRLCL